ncbi:TetR/AcrR family transcriptional regulator [Parvibaculum sp.]|uniref:TetR/AcrR family transcriptional regulator n=1 Tax=Parvibaculum sp. TaxID=2024848 RepID=UPI00320E377D
MTGTGKRTTKASSAGGGKPVRPVRRGKAQAVDMEVKTQPLQKRSRKTYDAILAAAGALLEEVGIEQLSTNLVCKRAKLSPPALYRYFPNKYALLRELGARLMERQDEAVFEWLKNGELKSGSVEKIRQSIFVIQARVNEITMKEPGGRWIMRALRAVPTLREVRIASRELVAARIGEALASIFPSVSPHRLLVAARLTTELGYAAGEMAVDEPEHADELVDELAWMFALYFEHFRK